MRIRKHAARKAGVEHPSVADGWLREELTEERRRYMPKLSVDVEGKGRKVLISVRGLRGYEGPGDQATYAYWIEMSVSELAKIVAEVMKSAPSAELLEAVAAGAAAALPRRSRRANA